MTDTRAGSGLGGGVPSNSSYTRKRKYIVLRLFDKQFVLRLNKKMFYGPIQIFFQLFRKNITLLSYFRVTECEQRFLINKGNILFLKAIYRYTLFETTTVRRYKTFARRINDKNGVRVNARCKRGHLAKQLYKAFAHAYVHWSGQSIARGEKKIKK